uniref:Fungal lipase-like domain-containing protein n=1 Tax=Panagrolaimus sp. ES5 TaxID=591445 RepID=A0AC34FLR0_9BILA
MLKIYILLIILFNASAQYSDELARRKFWTMTAVPYANNRYCTDLCFNSYEYYKTVEVNCDLMKNGSGHISALGFVKPEKVKLIAFAGPHGGDQIWADKMTTLVPYAYRVVHAHDLVPHMPFDVHPEWKYTHHTKEIWYNNTMDTGASYLECDEQESSKCSNS